MKDKKNKERKKKVDIEWAVLMILLWDWTVLPSHTCTHTHFWGLESAD